MTKPAPPSSLNVKPAEKPPFDLWEFLGSMRFAIEVLVAAAGLSLAALLASELLPQSTLQGRIGRALMLSDPFRSWWFRLLLAVLAVSLFVCVVQRGPVLVRQAFTRTWRLQPAMFIGFPGAAAFRSSDGVRDVTVLMKRLGLGLREREVDGGTAVAGMSGGLSRLGPLLSHLGMLLLILGGLAAGVTGSSDQYRGQAGDVIQAEGWDFGLRIDEFKIVYYPISLNQWVELSSGQRGQVIRMAGDSALVRLPARGGGSTDRWLPKSGLRNDFLMDGRTPYTGNIKSYITRAAVLDASGQTLRNVEIEVNKPLRQSGWRFYQSSFEASGRADRTVIDTLVVACSGASGDTVVVLVAQEGAAASLGDGWHLKLLGFYPDFRLDSQNRPFSASGRLNNPAARFTLSKEGAEPLTQYAFQQNIGAMGHAASPWTLQLSDFKGVRQVGGMATILTVNREHGRWLIWWGFAFATIGLLFAYMTTHRHGWALVLKRDGGVDEVHFLASSTRSDFGFYELVQRELAQFKRPH